MKSSNSWGAERGYLKSTMTHYLYTIPTPRCEMIIIVTTTKHDWGLAFNNEFILQRNWVNEHRRQSIAYPSGTETNLYVLNLLYGTSVIFHNYHSLFSFFNRTTDQGLLLGIYKLVKIILLPLMAKFPRQNTLS